MEKLISLHRSKPGQGIFNLRQILLHPFAKQFAATQQFRTIAAFNGMIRHFQTVIVHVKKHLSVGAGFIQHIFIVGCTERPAIGAFCLREDCFADHIIVCRFGRRIFHGITQAAAFEVGRSSGTCPVEYRRDKVDSVIDQRMAHGAGLIDRSEVPVRQGDRVFVVGCGNTAIDAVRTALRFDAAEVTILYHRDITRMSTLRAEYDDAVAEGVKFMWNTAIKSINIEDSQLVSLTVETDGTPAEVGADKVILAVGNRPASSIVSTTTGIETDENGYVLTRDYPYGMTTRKGVFAGGDVWGNQATVVHAMSDAPLPRESPLMSMPSTLCAASADPAVNELRRYFICKSAGSPAGRLFLIMTWYDKLLYGTF